MARAKGVAKVRGSAAASERRASAGSVREAAGGLEVRAVGPGEWPAVERLFGGNGACGGCWCMWWRVPMGGAAWERAKGEGNRRVFKELVEGGRARGLLARRGGSEVGWCCVGPRGEFPRAERVKAIRGPWDQGTWSVVCFFIPARERGRGVATALLEGAVAAARAGGASTLEGYPVRAKGAAAREIPAAFAWTGVVSMFERAGFVRAGPRGARELWKLELRPAGAARRIEKLANLGPVSRRWLEEVGIRTRADLERAGAVAAYRAVRERQGRASMNLLYALEAALLDVHWAKLPPDLKRRLAEAVASEGAKARRGPGRRRAAQRRK